MEEGIRCLPDAAIALDRFDEDCGDSIGRDLRGKHLLERCERRLDRDQGESGRGRLYLPIRKQADARGD